MQWMLLQHCTLKAYAKLSGGAPDQAHWHCAYISQQSSSCRPDQQLIAICKRLGLRRTCVKVSGLRSRGIQLRLLSDDAPLSLYPPSRCLDGLSKRFVCAWAVWLACKHERQFRAVLSCRNVLCQRQCTAMRLEACAVVIVLSFV